jgi:hypothetical protein
LEKRCQRFSLSPGITAPNLALAILQPRNFFLIGLFRVSCEGIFTTEAQSSQSKISEFEFLISLCALRASAVGHTEA